MARSDRPSVAVLMATYNGEKYVAEQVQSLAAQSFDNLHLYIRDDGSTDRTISIILETLNREGRHLPLKLEEGEHVGVPHAFFHLLLHAPPSHDYYAFADQDDIWFPTKVQHALETLQPLEDGRPLLYFCRQRYVTKDLTPVGYSPLVKNPGLANALVQNPAKGCTQVFNRAAFKLVRENLPLSVPWHDWWVYLTVAAMGKVVFDPRIEIDYRLHKRSAIGEVMNPLAKTLKRLGRLLQHGNLQARSQAEIFLKTHAGKLPTQAEQVIRRFVEGQRHFKDRFRYALTMDVCRLDPWENVALRFLIIMNRS